MNALHWTKPYFGVSHGYLAARPSLANPWVTVNEYESFAKLTRIKPGFPAQESIHETADDAKEVGAKWINGSAA